MATTSELPASTAPPPIWAVRVAGWHWGVPVAIAAGLLGVLFVVVVLIRDAIPVSPDGRAFDYRHAAVYSMLCAYTLGAGLLALSSTTNALDRLRPVLTASPSTLAALRRRIVPDLAAIARAATIGGLLAVVLHYSPLVFAADPPDAWPRAPYEVPFMVLLFGLLGVVALVTSRQSRLFREIGRSHVEVDLLEPGKLAPFGGVGLRGAANWFLGSALASFLTVGASNPTSVVLVILATTGLGVAALVVPSTGLHARLRDAKRAELARVRARIAEEREALLGEGGDGDRDAGLAARADRGTRMPALLAYEERIESVREWPIDTATLRRFGLFLLIPMASWIGGALVERLVDAALG